MQKTIRSVKVSDAKAIRDIYAPFVSDSAISFETDAPDVLDMEQKILELQDQYPWLVFERDGMVLGYAYASSHRKRRAYRWCVEVSVYVHASARKCGMGRALYTALFDLLRRQGYVNAYAGITLPNPSSVGLHELLGFVPIGVFERIGFKLGRWHDVAWFQLRLREDPVPPENFLPAKSLFEERQVAAKLRDYAQSVRLG
jgi:L-amino acid N-acyltransferase YncA